MGECPQWYLIIRAARYLGVAPWDLAEQPVTWYQWALAAEAAEAHAEAEHTKRAQSQAKMKRGRH